MQSRKRSLEGYPLKAYAFVRENPGDDRDLLLSKNTVCLADKDTVISSRQDEYRVQYCYGSESTSQGISARTIQPLLRQLMEGYNVALLLVSSRGSDGTNLLLGKTTANWTGVTDDAAGGLVHEAAKALFDVLHEKCLHIDEQLAMQRIHPVAGGLQYAVESTFLQICGEEGCRDLHAPGNACYLQRCPRMLPGGFDFTGLKTRPAYEAQDLVHAFMQGTSDASLLSVGVDGQEHGLIFSIHLTQHAASDVPDRDPVELVSHMLIAVLPSLWTSLPNSVTTSGNAPQASKMLHTLTSTLYALACGDHELATSTIRSSYMMQLLSENLTGNCVTAFLGLLRQGQGAMSRAVLDVLQMAQMVHSTPIANTGAAQGLLQRLRTAISKVEAHGAQALTWSGTGQNDPVLTAAKLEKMGGRLREALLEREGLEAQKGELQSERDSLQVEKEGLQEQLVASEESVLQLTRSLLDLRLEFNSVRDMLESEEYKTEKRASAGLLNGDELNSRELTELAELRGKMEENNKRCRREAEELQAALAEVSAAADQEAAEASSARASLHECRRNYLARIQHLILQVGDMGRAVELAGGDSKSAFCPRKEGFLGLARELAAHVLAVWTDAQDESRQQLELLETRHSTLRRHLRALLSAYHQLRYRLEEAGEHVQDGRQQFSEATLDSLLQQEENVARELLAEMRDKVSLLTRMLQEQRLLQSTHGQEENGAFSQDDLLLLQLNGVKEQEDAVGSWQWVRVTAMLLKLQLQADGMTHMSTRR
eukprot:jgi/Botrbrau1/6964/Bobra.0165s0003.2